MKKSTLLALAVVAACHSSSPSTTSSPRGSMTGAAGPEQALESYLAAAHARDLQAMSAVWGTSKGSVRETMDMQEIEKREMTVMGVLCQDQHKILERLTGAEGRRNYRVELRKGTKGPVNVMFVTVQGPGSRWYVEDVQLTGEIPQRLQTMCR